MVVVRIMFVLLIASLVANCARNFDKARYVLAEQNAGTRVSLDKRPFAKAQTDYDGIIAFKESRQTPRVEVDRSNVGGTKEKQGDGMKTVDATAVRPFDASSPVTSPKHKLDKLVAEDEEYSILKAKTIICHAC